MPRPEEIGRRRIYETMLGTGLASQEAYYRGLRRLGVAATPADEEGHLYAPNPVVVSQHVVEEMTDDLNRFCDFRRDELRDADDLSAACPPAVREVVGGAGVAARLVEDLRRAHPLACLDAYLVETGDGLERAYLEWQTFPAYPATAIAVLEVIAAAFPGLEEAGASFSPLPGESLAALRDRVRAVLVRGVEDDPRRGVLVDFEPEKQETRREFWRTQELTGGDRARGFGIVDPREVRYVDGRPHYRRDGRDLPIGAVFSRLVHDDLERRLLPALGPDERQIVTRFFGDERIDWRVHPLHFLYGSKGDFPRFLAAGLSAAVPETELVTRELIEAKRRDGIRRLEHVVQKPVEGHGGREIIPSPAVDELEEGALLQAIIQPAECHETLYGPRAPEVRVMGLPGPDGRLFCSSVFTRVKAPDEFRSNAGVTARAGAPGTGEGYAVIAMGIAAEGAAP